jgi:hypothetical protein
VTASEPAKNVFLVLTPLQVVNAIEARHAFDTVSNCLVLLSIGQPRSQLEELVDARDWSEVHVIDAMATVDGHTPRLQRYASMLAARRALDRLAQRLGAVEGLFLGNYESRYARHLAARLCHEKLYVLDDGTGTVLTAEQRLGHHVSQFTWDQSAKLGIRNRLLGFVPYDASSLVFFTSFDIRVTGRDEVVRNSFARLRRDVVGTRIIDELWFLGQSLVEDAVMIEATYFGYVKAAMREANASRFVYVPHRRENPDRVARLSRELGVEVRVYGRPIEVELVKSDVLPSVLGSFYCAALDNCRQMFSGSGMQVRSIAISRDDLINLQDFVAAVYDYFRRHEGNGFSVEVVDPRGA